MGYLLLLCVFVIVPLPALLGVWSVRLARGTLGESEFVNPPTIAVGFALVLGASALVAISSEWEQQFGPWAKYQGVYAAVTFAIGLTIGWLESRNAK